MNKPEDDDLKHYEEVQKELKRQLINFRFVTLAILGLIAFSTWFMHWQQGWKWLDSVYYVIVTMATVGYGDFVPTKDSTKIYAMCLITVGIASFGYFASLLLKRQQLRAVERELKRLQKQKTE